MFSNNILIVISIAIVITSFYFINPKQFILKSLMNNSSCPFCYGQSLCDDVNNGNISLKLNDLDSILKLISTKNVYNGFYNRKHVILKQLGYSLELKEINTPRIKTVSKQDILEYFNTHNFQREFILCDYYTSNLFYNDILSKWNLEQIWTMAHINTEPLVLHIYNWSFGYPVPKLIGSCGKTIVVENRGKNLIYFENSHWLHRAYIALQLIQALNNFTFKHHTYRLYLTDLSPDNVVVDPNTMKISFIDMESALLIAKRKDKKMHFSIDFKEHVFSTMDICQSSISDHNIYSTFKIFLSKDAQWPMMEKGLLHNPPISVIVKYKLLFKYIEYCVVVKKRRFYYAKRVVNLLKDLLESFDYVHYVK